MTKLAMLTMMSVSVKEKIHHHVARMWRGFTIIEVLVVIIIIALLVGITVVVYGGMQERLADSAVRDTVGRANGVLQIYGATDHQYPANIAGTDYAPPITVAVALYTNAAQVPIYAGLTTEQNSQLFLNTCNGFMSIESGGITYNTACVYNGNNLHVKGTVSSNVVIHGPSIDSSDIVLTCGTVCTTARDTILATFLAQGGTFPINVISSGATLPQPTLSSMGDSTRYCLEGRSPQFPDIIYHATSDKMGIFAGACPADPELHYP